jgi:hypothetical protein
MACSASAASPGKARRRACPAARPAHRRRPRRKRSASPCGRAPRRAPAARPSPSPGCRRCRPRRRRCARVLPQRGDQVLQALVGRVAVHGDHAVVGAQRGDPAHGRGRVRAEAALRQVEQRAARKSHQRARPAELAGGDAVERDGADAARQVALASGGRAGRTACSASRARAQVNAKPPPALAGMTQSAASSEGSPAAIARGPASGISSARACEVRGGGWMEKVGMGRVLQAAAGRRRGHQMIACSPGPASRASSRSSPWCRCAMERAMASPSPKPPLPARAPRRSAGPARRALLRSGRGRRPRR